MKQRSFCMSKGFYNVFRGKKGWSELSAQFRYLVDQPFGFLPAQAGIGDGFAVNVLAAADLLGSGLQIAFDHEALYQGIDPWIVVAASQYLPGDSDLLFVFFVGVGVVGIYDGSRIFQTGLLSSSSRSS